VYSQCAEPSHRAGNMGSEARKSLFVLGHAFSAAVPTSPP